MPRESFHRELDGLRADIVAMGVRVDEQIDRAARALMQGDVALADAVRRDDATINAEHARIDRRAVALIAEQSPVAGDLRVVLAALFCATELERMADHAADIGEIVMAMRDVPAIDPPRSIARMAERVRRMLRDAIAAYERGDVDGARALARDDDVVDALQEETYRALMDGVSTDGVAVERAIYLALAAHHLERVADRATNIAEQVVYVATGALEELNASSSGATGVGPSGG
jgi:phosphate transport system protein